MMQMMKADGLSFAFMLAYQLVGGHTVLDAMLWVQRQKWAADE